MYKSYKITLTERELNRLNLIENESIRKSCMSILSYLLKKHLEENKKYIDTKLEHLKDQSKFKISFRKFLDKYTRSHEKISIGTLKNRIDLLLKYQLIKLECKSTYSFFRSNINNSVNENMNNSKSDQTVVTTSVQAPIEEHKYLNTKINNKNIINNRVNHPTQSKIFVTSLGEIKEQLDHQLNKFNIIYDFAVKETERRIKNAIKKQTLRFIGVEEYLIKTLVSIKNQFIPNCLKKKDKLTIEQQDNTTTVDTTTTVLEDVLKADKISKSNCNCNIIEYNKEDSFNAYEQRSYDFDKLEPQLLGWTE